MLQRRAAGSSLSVFADVLKASERPLRVSLTHASHEACPETMQRGQELAAEHAAHAAVQRLGRAWLAARAPEDRGPPGSAHSRIRARA
jgi:hypothetical protein